MKTRKVFHDWARHKSEIIAKNLYPYKMKYLDDNGISYLLYYAICKGYEYGLEDAKQVISKRKEE